MGWMTEFPIILSFVTVLYIYPNSPGTLEALNNLLILFLDAEYIDDRFF